MSGSSSQSACVYRPLLISLFTYSGIYCLIVVAYLLDLLTPELVQGTPSFIASCQTYEGGFSCASQPYYSANLTTTTTPTPTTTHSYLLSHPRPPLGEAHGGYTFCALASWVMLQPYLSTHPDGVNPKPRINYKTLLRWLTSMQGSEAELGGFKGRTNKLVDGCYSWWVGGAFSLFEAVCMESRDHREEISGHECVEKEEGPDGWDDVDGMLTNIVILVVCSQ